MKVSVREGTVREQLPHDLVYANTHTKKNFKLEKVNTEVYPAVHLRVDKGDAIFVSACFNYLPEGAKNYELQCRITLRPEGGEPDLGPLRRLKGAAERTPVLLTALFVPEADAWVDAGARFDISKQATEAGTPAVWEFALTISRYARRTT